MRCSKPDATRSPRRQSPAHPMNILRVVRLTPSVAIATSKKNGMWMGGMPPLGYDAVVGLGTLATKLSQKGLDFGRNQSVTVEERSGSDRPGSCPAGYTPAAGFRW